MAKPRKGVIPPQLRAYLFKKGASRTRRARRASKTKQVYSMARRSFRRRGSRGFGGGNLVMTAVKGGIVGVLAKQFLPSFGMAGQAVAGYLVTKKVEGALAAAVAPMAVEKVMPNATGSKPVDILG